MKYTVEIIPWSGTDEIPYSRELEDTISEAVVNWIYENIEYPGHWTTYMYAEQGTENVGPAIRLN